MMTKKDLQKILPFAFLGIAGLYLGTRRRNPGGDDPVKEFQEELKTLENQGIIPSYSDAQFASYADAIFAALDGYTSHSDQVSVTQILSQMNNDADVAKLVKAFGTRRIEDITGFFGTRLTLPAAIRDELEAGQIDSLNSDYSWNGLKFRW